MNAVKNDCLHLRRLVKRIASQWDWYIQTPMVSLHLHFCKGLQRSGTVWMF